MLQFKSAGCTRVRALWRAALLLFLAGSLQQACAADPASAPDAIQSVPADAQTTGLERYLSWRATRFVDWLADGSMLIATRFGTTQQIHRLRAPLGMREQLSFESADVINAAARPYGGDAFVYQLGADAGHGSSLRLMRLADRAIVPLTRGEFRDELPVFAHDGERVAFSSDRGADGGGGADRAIFVQDTGDPDAVPRRVAGSPGERWQVLGWSTDDRRLLLGREVGVAGGFELHFVDLRSGAVTPVQLPVAAGARGHRPEAPEILRARAARFAPDGHGLLVLGYPPASVPASAADPAQFVTLRYVDPGTGETRELTPGASHDVEQFETSADGRYLAYTLNDEGVSRLMLIDQQRRLESAVAEVPAGIIHRLKFDATGTHLALSVETAESPEDVYVYQPDDQMLTRWSAGERGPVDPARLQSPQLRQFPTWDRVDGQPRLLRAYVYGTGVPLAPGEAARPVLVLLRGAAGGQFRPGYDPLLQYLVSELRFVVVAPNLRGASGYGRGFSALADGALRNDAARDVGSLLAWVGLQDGLDRGHTIVMGEGAADALALTVLAQYADRVQAGIAVGPPVVPALPTAMTIHRPVLLAATRPGPEGAAPVDAFAILALRLRTSGINASSLSCAAEDSGGTSPGERDRCALAIAAFLKQLLR